MNTKIGAPDGEKGISGGEKKRLAVASELLTNPSILFCDEPTSGLDSYMALNVVEVLRDMAQTGRTIVCTIHQPSSEVFALFTQLLLMADGRVAYLGRSENAIEFFSTLGLQCPNNYNPSDFYIKQLSIIPGNEIESKQKLNNICDRYLESTYSKLALPLPAIENNDNFKIQTKTSNSIYKTNWFVQFWALLWRATLAAIREPMLTTVRLGQTVILAVVFGLIYWQLDVNQAGIMDINGALFLLIANITFQNIFGVVTHNNGMYRVSAYFLSKILAELPSFMFNPLLYLSIFYWMVGLNSGIKEFFICVAICLLVADTACSFGYLVSCMSSGITMALTITPTIIMPMMIFGGFFLNNELILIFNDCMYDRTYSSVPVYFVWFKYISWFYYGNEALSINQWKSIDHIDCEFKMPTNQTIMTPCIPNGKVVIETLNFNEDHLIRNILLLAVLSFVVRFLAFIALWIRSLKR
ncbi:unnamed protein product [Oppiella nova]|uniref:Uncharacterized protein n=1 Tax=Oppiella nova TaxID=334625 RepID=A0A7R9MBT9_9ACAR|nr:unnamed protein product [Oppiella nova]CAG2173978.1 unnamed protein product [Oppiella nova]